MKLFLPFSSLLHVSFGVKPGEARESANEAKAEGLGSSVEAQGSESGVKKSPSRFKKLAHTLGAILLSIAAFVHLDITIPVPGAEPPAKVRQA